MFYKMLVSAFTLALVRSFQRTFGTLDGAAAFVADVYRRATLAGMTALPAEFLAAIVEDVKRAEKRGTASAISIPEGFRDVALYIPAVSINPFRTAGVVTAEDVEEVTAFNAKHAPERTGYVMARRAAGTMTRIRRTLAALDSGELAVYRDASQALIQ